MDTYQQIVLQCKERHGIRVHRWRTAMSGCAWRTDYANGQSINWIEAPYPRSPISLAVFLHEVGHQVIGFDDQAISAEEELRAWNWAIEQMVQFGIEPDQRVRSRYLKSMRYAVEKAQRKGIRELPESLARFAA